MAKGRHYGAAAELARMKYGGDCVEDEQIINVTNVSAIDLVTPDPERVFVMLINMGTTSVFLRTRGNPAVNQGVRLSAAGGMISFDADNDATMPTKGWRAIADTAASDVYRLTLRRETVSKEG